MERIRRNIVTGLLASLPLLLTAWIVKIVFDFLVAAGRPVVLGFAAGLTDRAPEVADLLRQDWFQSLLAAIVTLFALYLLGALTTAMVGRRLWHLFDRLMARIPFVEAVYGAVRKLITSFQQAPAGQQRVVLIEFPSPDMKTIGFVTKVFTTSDTGREVAAVYVPTAPNPTSGYMELVPVEKLVWLDWTANEAMQFILSGGTAAPDRLTFGS
ncbi:DUF502 domain-containing protein [Zavarzinia compransoris]|uniref:DUF502 domain-containing protein n=1 Tax=Zavarzinia compransoris TaxID=1264899 RepID=A0A317E9B0_9PROT|nr:DUF502 domain-containing protein [Zavarzinia compransoris]PWR21913.1 hypothetical protein DKG75_07995 [Zavarzinia compransoris]TDP47354.1 putative membrane protein [Zavarzinia compransoris]